jgi:hypothetical protein
MRKLLNHWLWYAPIVKLAAAWLVVGTAVALLNNYDSGDHRFIKPAHAQPTIPGPAVYPFASVTTAQTIINANTTRHALQICNAGGTNVLWIAPLGAPPSGTGLTGIGTAQVTPAANGAGSVGVPIATGGGVITCFSPPTNAPSIGQGWQGFSTGTAVTVYEWP